MWKPEVQTLTGVQDEPRRSGEVSQPGEDLLRRALRSSPIAVFSQDRNLRYTWVYNARLASADQAMLGKTDDELFAPKEAAVLSSLKRRVLTTREPTRQEVCVTLEGQRVFYDLAVDPLCDATGKVVGITSVATDITKRKQLEAEVLEINERIQRRLGQDLHDGVSQQLRGIAYLSHALQQTLEAKSVPEAQSAARITELLQKAIAETRDLARGLAPLRLEADGLMSALNELAAATRTIYGIACRFVCPKPVLISNLSVAIHLYRVAQEAVQNAVKHAKPRCVVIQLTKGANQLTLTVNDDGQGLPKGFVQGGGMGLRIMDYRARMIGARFDLKPGAVAGTVLSCVLPAEPWSPVRRTL